MWQDRLYGPRVCRDGQELPGEEDKALARGAALGTTTPGCTDLGSSSSGQQVLLFMCSGKKYFPSLISGILVFHLIMYLFVLQESKNMQ